MIHGEFIMTDIARGDSAIHIVGSEKDMPDIMDGGCGIINVIYSVETSRIVSIMCNGYA